MRKTVAILGASGFVGSSLVEHLVNNDHFDVTPFSHSTGGATCLAHQGLIFETLDIVDRKSVERALKGFDYVVNCSRGGPEVMLDGLDNLLHASSKANIKKLVHLSSVAVYGDPPHPDSVFEDAPTRPGSSGYGAVKLEQDKKVQEAARKGLGAVILCPPNIIGAYSGYLMAIINSIEGERFKLLDDGNTAINVVDVINLCACVECALSSEIEDGRRLFVCEPEAITWADLCDALKPLLRSTAPIPSLGSADFAPAAGALPGPEKTASGSALKHLVSDEVREALRIHPTWATVENAAKGAVRFAGGRVEDYMRVVAGGRIQVPTQRPADPWDTALISQQLRKVRHDPTKSFASLAFKPPFTFADSMDVFRNWYLEFFDNGSAEWRLLGEAAKN